MIRRLALAAVLIAALAIPRPAVAQQFQTATGQIGAQATTTACTSAACVTLPAASAQGFAGQSTCWADVAVPAAFTGTIVFEIGGGSGNWYQVPVTSWSGGAGTAVTSVSAAALVSFPAGPGSCRARASSYTAGSANVFLYASSATSAAGASSPSGGSSVTIAGPTPLAVTTAAPCTAGTCNTTVTPSGVQNVAPYAGLTAQAPFILTAGSATTCTAVATTSALLTDVTNAATSAQTQTLALFNDNGTCAAANRIVQIVLGASQTVTFGPGKYFNTALSYTLTGAATANIALGYAK